MKMRTGVLYFKGPKVSYYRMVKEEEHIKYMIWVHVEESLFSQNNDLSTKRVLAFSYTQ